MLFVIRVLKLLEVVEFKLKEVISREPTLLVMVVGVPNVGKSALINAIHQIALSRFAGKMLPYFVLTIVMNYNLACMLTTCLYVQVMCWAMMI